MKEVKYQDYRIGSYTYTVRLTYLPAGGILHYNPTVRVDVMKWHLPPTTFLGKITEGFKYALDTYEWDPCISKLSLADYCIDKCLIFVEMREAVEKANTEWDSIK